MRYLSLVICILTAVIGSLYGQNKPFFLDLKNSSVGLYYYQTATFCTNVNQDEVIYINNSDKVNPPILEDYFSKIIHSKKNGHIIKEINLDEGDRRCISSFGTNIGNQILVMSYTHSSDSIYLKVRNYDKSLNLLTAHDFPITTFSPEKTNLVNSYVNTMQCKDDNGNTYILLISLLDDRPVQCLSLRPDGTIIKFAFFELPIGDTVADGLYYDKFEKNIVLINSNSHKLVIDKDFKIIKIVDLTKDNDPLHVHDTISGWTMCYINADDTIVRLDKAQFHFNHNEPDNYYYIQGMVLSYADRNGNIAPPIYLEELIISPESEGIPRLSGGLFYRDSFYYTYFEYSSTAFPFYTGNRTILSKFNRNLNLVDQAIFVVNPDYRLFTVWAELTEDNSFIGSGFYYNVANADPFNDAGSFVIGYNADGTPPTLQSHSPFLQAIFVVKGNPTSQYLVIETDEAKAQNYEVKILDTQGKPIKSSSSWSQGRISIDMRGEKPGVYLYHIFDNGKPITGGKFVKI